MFLCGVVMLGDVYGLQGEQSSQSLTPNRSDHAICQSGQRWQAKRKGYNLDPDVRHHLCSIALLAFSTVASAQSSVTLYGRVDGGVE
jgi:hypothetical protein